MDPRNRHNITGARGVQSARPPEAHKADGAAEGGPEGVVQETAQVEVSAGGIVFKRTPRGVRVAFILDPFGKWAFAKGHVEAGESVEHAAVRETMEEMGLDQLRIVTPLGVIDFWFRDRYRKEMKGVLVHKYVHYYLMEAPSDAKGKPQRQEKIRRIIWVGLGRLMKTSSYDDVRPILEKVYAYFRREQRRERMLLQQQQQVPAQPRPPIKNDPVQ
jgi:ADP-ribose pyrophosphatase YjhB (NUDIX family)